MLGRIIVLTCALLFGIPAVALLLAHMGFIALPADAYVSSVSTTTQTWTAGRDPFPVRWSGPSAAAGKAAINAANALLPHYEPDRDRDWDFHETPTRSAHNVAATMTVCADCPTGSQLLFVGAIVDRIRDNIATVTLQWSLHRTERIYNARGEMISPGSVAERGEIVIFLKQAYGRWGVIEPE